jgi:hypothetical protein
MHPGIKTMSTTMEKLTGFLARMRDSARKRRTARILESLPDYIRKDIGWSGDRRPTRV